MELSIIIVHYKTPDLLEKCVCSILEHTKSLTYEIIIINNDDDRLAEVALLNRHPTISWFNMGYNAGFARANNKGIKLAKGEYIVLLNPDASLRKNTFKSMIDFYQKKEVEMPLGILTCRIVSSVDGALQVGSGKGFPVIMKYLKQNPIYIYATRRWKTPEKSYIPEIMHYTNHEIDFASGACSLIRKEKITRKENLLLDEDFFLYWEDVEWSYRLKTNKLRHFFLADTEIYHINSASTNTLSNRDLQIYISEILFNFKAYSKFRWKIYSLLRTYNNYLDDKLAKKANDNFRITPAQNRKLIFKYYSRHITNLYDRTVSSGNEYLRYDPEVLSK